jgi:hypothetical protein
MSASGFPGRRDDSNRAGMMTTVWGTDGDFWRGSRDETGSTANHNTAENRAFAAAPAEIDRDAKIRVLVTMNWKSTVLVSGAGLLATWLANIPSPTTTQSAATAAATTTVAPQPGVSAEIQQLADRLERQRTEGRDFTGASRDLFRFRPTPRVAQPAAVVTAPPAAIQEPAKPVIHLSGVAMDRVGDADVWTAILSVASGVVLARTGDQVGDGWTVTSIGPESVDLTRADGSTLTLPLSGK